MRKTEFGENLVSKLSKSKQPRWSGNINEY